jgi:CRP-like cAMP-binding protein
VEQFKSFLQNFAPITDTEFVEAQLYFKELNLKKGDLFIEQGKICKHIAFIKHGTLITYYNNDKGEEITSCFCVENNFTTSYKSFILQIPSTQSIQAIEETQLLSIDFDSLQKLYAKSIVWQNIGRAFAEREYVVMEQYASILNHETAKEKYLRLLKEQPTVIQKASIKDIASYLGVTSRTLSRIRQEIAKRF